MTELRRTHTALDTEQANAAKLRDEAASLRRELTDSRAERDSLAKRHDGLLAEIKAAETRIADLEQRRDSAEKQGVDAENRRQSATEAERTARVRQTEAEQARNEAISQQKTAEQRAETADFSHTLDWALRWALLIGTPATVALMILAGPILAALFQYGEFDARDVTMSARSLMAFALGLVAFMLIKVLAPGFYARQDTRTPVKYGLIAMGANTALTLILIWPLAHAGLALSTALAAFLNAGLLGINLRRRGIYQPRPGWEKFLLQLTAANLAMGLVLWFGAGDLERWLHAGAGERLWHLTWLMLAGGGSYLLAGLAVGIRPRHLLHG